MHAASLAPLLSSARQRWLLLAALLALFVAASIQYTVKVADRNESSAFGRWREQIRSLDQGRDIYKDFTYPNPPIMVLILRPLAQLPPLAGSLCWFYLKVLLTLFALEWAFRLVETPDRPMPLWARAVAVLLAVRPMLGDLAHGNVNLFILFLVVGGLYALRQGRDVGAGIALALAIACKVTPALFIPYFLWKRAWKTLAGILIGLLLFFWLIPGCLLGFARNHELLHSWVENMVKPFVVRGEVYYSDHNNQSLPGLMLRLATPSPSFRKWDVDHFVPVHYHNLANLDPHQAGLIVKGCMALFAGLIVWTCRTPLAQRSGWRLSAEFSLVLLGMLLFSERTWKHHCVTMLLPFAVLVYYLATCRPAAGLRFYLIGTLTAVALLMTATSTGPDGEDFSRLAVGKIAQAYGVYVWAYLLLGAALVVLLRRADERLCLEMPLVERCRARSADLRL